MRASDLIRAVLDLIDTFETSNRSETQQDYIEPDSEAARIRQISAFLNQDETAEYSNTPCEIVSDVDSVTTQAGGGVNGSKHSKDIRIKDPRGYE